MLLSILFALACAAFGYYAARAFRLQGELALGVGIAGGVLAGAWLSLAISWFGGELSVWSIIIPIALLLAGALALKRIEKGRFEFDKKVLAGLAAFALLFLLLNYRCTLEPNASGGASSLINVWGDGPFHYGLINSFVHGANFPPEYPVLDGARLAYPFLMDYFSAVLVAGGLGLREAVVWSNAIVFFALACVAFAFFKRLGGKRVAAIALLLFFLNGNAGVFNAAGNGFELSMDYSHIEAAGLHFMNLTYALFVPQRSILLGYAIAAGVFCLFYDYCFGRGRKESLLLAGILSGLLPMAHAHSALAVGLVFAGVFAFKPGKDWLWFFVPAALLGLPQLAFMLAQAQTGFSGVHLWWLNAVEGRSLFEVAVFWLRNAWLVGILGVIGYFIAKPNTKKFILPFAAFFILGNLVRFQAWDWDNIKILSYWYFAFAGLAAITIDKMWASRKHWVRLVGTALLLLAVASGALTMAWACFGENARYQVYSTADFELAEWVKGSTPANAVFLTGDSPQDPVSSLAGRSIVMGFNGWLWSHGLDYHDRVKLVHDAYREPSCEILKELGADFVLVSHREESLEPNYQAFASAPFLEPAYSMNGYSIYRVNC